MRERLASRLEEVARSLRTGTPIENLPGFYSTLDVFQIQEDITEAQANAMDLLEEAREVAVATGVWPEAVHGLRYGVVITLDELEETFEGLNVEYAWKSVFGFDEAKAKFLALCQKHGIPCPRVVPALPSDPCDVTSSDEVRLNIAAAQPIEPDYYVRHVFGHFLCDLHSNANDKTADMVADLIADLITNPTPRG